MLEMWTLGARVMARDPETGATRELTFAGQRPPSLRAPDNAVTHIGFADGTTFPEMTPVEQPERRTVKTTDGREFEVR